MPPAGEKKNERNESARESAQERAQRNPSAVAIEDAEGTEALDEVQAYAKADFANPESPVLPVADKQAEGETRDPEPVEIEEGDTVAAHESHTLMSSPEKISQRIELEKEGIPTDVIARRQQEEAADKEFQRVDGGGRLAGAGKFQAAATDPDAVGRAVADALRGGTPEQRKDARAEKKDEAKASS